MSGGAYRVREMEPDEEEAVLRLVLSVFRQFNGAQYGDHPERFTDNMTPERLEELADEGLVLVALSSDDTVAGVIAFEGRTHLELLFVDPAHHRQGVATTLWETARLWLEPDEVTVNASDYAEPWYLARGFAHEAGHVSARSGAPIKRMVWRAG